MVDNDLQRIPNMVIQVGYDLEAFCDSFSFPFLKFTQNINENRRNDTHQNIGKEKQISARYAFVTQ